MNSIVLDSVDSTNAEARRLIDAGAIAGPTVIRAREQTAGRGTAGRSWLSPRDAGLYLTIIDPTLAGGSRPTGLWTLAAGVAAAETLVAHTGLDVRLKPVNDLHAGGGKLGGILTEAIVEQGRMGSLLTGIGINTHRATRGPANAAVRAVALEDLLSARDFHATNLDAVLTELVAAVRSWHRRVADGWRDDVLRAYRRRLLDGADLPAEFADGGE